MDSKSPMDPRTPKGKARGGQKENKVNDGCRKHDGRTKHPFNTDNDDSHNEMPREPGYFTFASSKVGYYSTADAH